jgi:hypothetical protein
VIGTDKYRHPAKVAAMDFNDERDDLTNDDAVVAYRARAAAEIDQIAQHVRQSLTERGIDMPVFFIIPNSGSSIITFGCPGDPSDAEWARVGAIVSVIVQQSLGLRGTRCRKVQCATT